jgi:hypothetical protein
MQSAKCKRREFIVKRLILYTVCIYIYLTHKSIHFGIGIRAVYITFVICCVLAKRFVLGGSKYNVLLFINVSKDANNTEQWTGEYHLKKDTAEASISRLFKEGSHCRCFLV